MEIKKVREDLREGKTIYDMIKFSRKSTTLFWRYD